MTMQTLTERQRASLRKIAEAATPGPWTTEQAEDTESTTFIEHDVGDIIHHGQRGHGHLHEEFAWMHRADAAHIAAFNPAMAQRLLDTIDALEQERDLALAMVKSALNDKQERRARHAAMVVETELAQTAGATR